MKKRWIQLIAGLSIFVLCISVFTTTIDATVIWQDDFSDPNLPGWTLYGYTDYINETEWVKTEGNFSVADGTLKVLDDEINIARHESDVTVGSWSFDMYIPNDDFAAIYVEIMSNGTSGWFGATNTSHVSVGYWNDKYIVWVWVEGVTLTIYSRIFVDPLDGWHHIDVTRTSGGYFVFYFDGVVPTTVVGTSNFTSLAVKSSTYLQFYCENGSGAAIDNLVVRDDFITPTPSTGGDGGDDWTLIIIGVVVAAAVIALVIVFLRRK